MYEEIAQDDNVARGNVAVTEIIAYDFVRIKTNEIGKRIVIEKGRRPYFCQTKEQERIFVENNPGVRTDESNSGVRTETFNIQLLESTAREFIDDPENVKQFIKKEDVPKIHTKEELDWLHQAHRLGIPTDGRSKEDIEAEIAFSKAASKAEPIATTTSVS